MSKPKIEAIYPLTFMQQALLLHALYEQNDQGFLHVTCSLQGALDESLFQSSWAAAIQRHAAMRTSIHWEKIEKPMQVVHPQAELKWAMHDWTAHSPEEQKTQLESLKNIDREVGLDLTKAPISRLALIKLSDEEHLLLWSCHHILLDGWSTTIILKDALRHYDAACTGEQIQFDAIPSYKNYLNWIQQQDLGKATAFWEDYLGDLEHPTLIGQNQPDLGIEESAYKTKSFSLSTELTAALQQCGQQQRVTMSTIVQGAWALLLSKYIGKEDITFGTTVSGRSAELPNIDQMAGLFMNVLPMRTTMPESQSIGEWLQVMQKKLMEARNFEYVSLNQILSWSKWSGASSIFDSLLVFENFPWSDIEAGEIALKDFQGGLTTTYPLTVVVQPEEELKFLLHYKTAEVSEAFMTWIEEQMVVLLDAFSTSPSSSIGEVLATFSAPAYEQNQAKFQPYLTADRPKVFFSKGKDTEYEAPQNAIQLQLTKMWEEIFGRHPIGIQENFFQIGGSSLLAVRLFAKIEQQLGRNLPPVSLLQHPTIKDLAQLLEKDEATNSWSALVPIRASGSQSPLFCVHAGGGHVFFYNAMAHHLGADQPVYAIQPLGMDGVEAYHNSIEEMATDYLKEIRTIQPKGPYSLLGTCFSNAVCFEMAKQLEKVGEEVSLLAIIDSPVHDWTFVSPPSFVEKLQGIPGRIQRLAKRFRQDARGAVSKMISAKRNKFRDLVDDNLYVLKNKQAKNLVKIQDKLAELYLAYNWQPYSGKITLIRSKQFSEEENYEFHISQWQELTEEKLEVFVVEGHHETLFDEPEAQYLSAQLSVSLAAKQSVKV